MNKQNHHAAIFDLDGTLLDTLDVLPMPPMPRCIQQVTRQHPVAAYRQFVGNGLRMLVRRPCPKGKRIASGLRVSKHLWNARAPTMPETGP